MAEPPTEPPEHPDLEPTRQDDIDFDTVGCWRDTIKRMLNAVRHARDKESDDDRHIALCQEAINLNAMHKSMNDALDTAQGFNDEHPSEEDMRSAHDDQQYHWAKDEGLLP